MDEFEFQCPECGAPIAEDQPQCGACGCEIAWDEQDEDFSEGGFDQGSFDQGGFDQGSFDQGNYDLGIQNRPVLSEQGEVVGMVQYNEEQRFCPFCNASVLPSARFCYNCGEAIDEDALTLGGCFDIPDPMLELQLVKPRCPECDAEIEYGIKQCPNCLADLMWENHSNSLISLEAPEETKIATTTPVPKHWVEYPWPSVQFDTFNFRLGTKARHLKVKDKYPPPTIVFSSY